MVVTECGLEAYLCAAAKGAACKVLRGHLQIVTTENNLCYIQPLETA